MLMDRGNPLEVRCHSPLKRHLVQIPLYHGLAVDDAHPRRAGLVELRRHEIVPGVQPRRSRRHGSLLIALEAREAGKGTPGGQVRGILDGSAQARLAAARRAGRVRCVRRVHGARIVAAAAVSENLFAVEVALWFGGLVDFCFGFFVAVFESVGRVPFCVQVVLDPDHLAQRLDEGDLVF